MSIDPVKLRKLENKIEDAKSIKRMYIVGAITWIAVITVLTAIVTVGNIFNWDGLAIPGIVFLVIVGFMSLFGMMGLFIEKPFGSNRVFHEVRMAERERNEYVEDNVL